MRKKLKDVCMFYSGTGFPIQYQGQTKGEYPFYKVGDIANNAIAGKIYLELCNNYISSDVAKMIKGCILPKDTVVFAKIGEALKLNRRAITSCDCLIDNNAMGIAPKLDFLRIQYFYFCMKNLKMQTLAESTTVPSVRKTVLEKYEIEVPSLVEQEEIEKKLTLTQKIIEKRRQELSYLDEIIKARFVEMFGDPATNPYNWDKVNISEVVGDKVSNGFFAKRDDYADDGNVSVMGVAYIVNRMYSQWQDLPRTNGTDKDIEKFEVKYGDMLFCRSSLVAEGIGKASIVPEDVPQNTLFECHVIRLPLDLSKCVPEYMQVFSTMEYFRQQIIAQSKTATMTTIGQDGILKADILLPPMSKQREFYAFVHQVNKSKFDTMTFAPIYDIINLYLHTHFYQGRR